MVAFLAAGLLNFAATYGQTYLTSWVGQRALQDLRRQIFRHLQRLSIGFYSRNKAGVLISRMTNDVQALDQLVTDGIVTLFSASLTLIGTAAILLAMDMKLALITFTVFPVLAIASVAFRIASADAYRMTQGEDRLDHLVPPGDAVGRADRARVRPGAAARTASSRASTTRTATPT